MSSGKKYLKWLCYFTESTDTFLLCLRMSTSEQRNLIFEVFDRLSKLQNLVLGEVSGFYSLIFYPTALLTAYLLTSTARTSGARFWLFVILGSSLACERCIVYFTISDGSGYLPADEASVKLFYRTEVPFLLILFIFFCRKKCTGVSGWRAKRLC